MEYPTHPEGATDWLVSMTPAHRAVFDQICDTNQSDWPEEFRLLCVEIGQSWGRITSTEMYHNAIACAVHHSMRGTRTTPGLKALMEKRDETGANV
jgi:hypothetical protein